MIASFHQIVYFVRTAVGGLRASPLPTLVSIATIALAVVPLGGLLIITGNMGALLHRHGESRQVTAFLDADLTPDAESALARRAAELDDVTRVELVTREAALERFRERLGGGALLDALEENPLPASIEVTLASGAARGAAAEAAAAALRALPGVEEVAGGEAWVEGYARALALVRSAGLALGAILAVATLLIVANTVRLAVYARRDELEILALVGASRTFLRVPYLIEGAIQGTLGGMLGVGLLYALFQIAVPQLGDALDLFLGWSQPEFLSSARSALLVASGAGFGLLGATLAVARTRVS
ncbi:permease-like cell division protein FtsX [Myxococcota bacterium]|nr:permease-like cell division protein FtsX [Myxococcota bacterium]MCZ7620014.1 permease-like cell division protein FtsX [Myxococcota bacterium]